MAYAYDPLNRLASVTDASGVTTYNYDAVGNLAGYSYPNGVSTSYTYDPLNRLTNMQSNCGTGPGCGVPGTPVASYAYILGLAGNRLSVVELSGRSVTYRYDDLYRLTSENVSGDPGGRNGVVSYTFDSVGNRTQRGSTLPAVVATGLLNYDANDRTSTDPYDANGNLLQSGAGTNVYDFENRLVQAGGVKLVYDGDGNRVKETIAGTTTSYLVADQNLTGYAQVMDELQSGAVSRTYSYGLSLISERQTLAGASSTSFYGFDGHGSVRYLTGSAGAVTDTYDYDAFGNLISSTGATPNNYLFAGEQFDSALGIYYNRARYYDQRQGRFWTMDTYQEDPQSPGSLHRFLYVRGNPLNMIDPSGNFDLADVALSSAIIGSLAGGLSGGLLTGSLKGVLLGAAGGGALGLVCSDLALCEKSAVAGTVNTVFQLAANLFDDYYTSTLHLPPPDATKQREALVSAFTSGVVSAITAGYFDPNDIEKVTAIQTGIQNTLNALGQGQTLSQALVQGLEFAIVGYLVQVGVSKDVGPQFFTDKAAEIIVRELSSTIVSTMTTVISPIQEHILRLDPPLHRFIYGN